MVLFPARATMATATAVGISFVRFSFYGSLPALVMAVFIAVVVLYSASVDQIHWRALKAADGAASR